MKEVRRDLSEEELQKRREALLARKRAVRRKKRRNAIIFKSVILAALIAVLAIAIWFISGGAKKISSNVTGRTSVIAENAQNQDGETGDAANGGSSIAARAGEAQRTSLISEARFKASQYDYEGAMESLLRIPDAESDSEIISIMADIETMKSNLVAVSPYDITSLYFQSLIVDPSRGFSLIGDEIWDTNTVNYCEWMNTTYEFGQILTQMYNRGYVLVGINDIIERETDENGYVHVYPKEIYLPQGKMPFILSVDDLNYYHSYNGRGMASRIVIGDNNKPKCEYYDASGNALVGSYDIIPILDDFIEIHPDFSYKGAKGTIALTGYNGILGYRTDYTYRDRIDIDPDQELYLAGHPDYSFENEVAKATAVAQCLKDDGWTFACHTWGRIPVGQADISWIASDTEKWITYVESIVGDTDIAMFAYGEDIAAWDEVYSQTEKFQYYKAMGFNVFAYSDSSTQIIRFGDEFSDGYFRMSRRALDGFRLWEAVYGGYDGVSDLVDAATVIDPARPTDAYLYSF